MKAGDVTFRIKAIDEASPQLRRLAYLFNGYGPDDKWNQRGRLLFPAILVVAAVVVPSALPVIACLCAGAILVDWAKFRDGTYARRVDPEPRDPDDPADEGPAA